jgi:hypothetical protein
MRDGFAGKLGLALLVGFVSLQEVVQLSQERVALNAVDHAGFLDSLTAGRGAAQAMHADGEEQGGSLRSNIQNIADDGILFNFDSHDNMTSYAQIQLIITAFAGKYKRELHNLLRNSWRMRQMIDFLLRK